MNVGPMADRLDSLACCVLSPETCCRRRRGHAPVFDAGSSALYMIFYSMRSAGRRATARPQCAVAHAPGPHALVYTLAQTHSSTYSATSNASDSQRPRPSQTVDAPAQPSVTKPFQTTDVDMQRISREQMLDTVDSKGGKAAPLAGPTVSPVTGRRTLPSTSSVPNRHPDPPPPPPSCEPPPHAPIGRASHSSSQSLSPPVAHMLITLTQ